MSKLPAVPKETKRKRKQSLLQSSSASRLTQSSLIFSPSRKADVCVWTQAAYDELNEAIAAEITEAAALDEADEDAGEEVAATGDFCSFASTLV